MERLGSELLLDDWVSDLNPKGHSRHTLNKRYFSVTTYNSLLMVAVGMKVDLTVKPRALSSTSLFILQDILVQNCPSSV